MIEPPDRTRPETYESQEILDSYRAVRVADT